MDLSPYCVKFIKKLSCCFSSIKIFNQVIENVAHVPNRREIFISYAKERDFAPLITENWYPISATDILKWKDTALDAYKGNIIKALAHLFPEVTFDEPKFHKLQSIYYRLIY